MYNIINLYINKLTKEDIIRFSLSKGANLNNQELDFTYNFIKKNASSIIKNPSIFDIDRYSKYYSEENFSKIKLVFNEYFQKFNSLSKNDR